MPSLLRFARIFILLCLACLSWQVKSEVAVPPLTARVIDQTGTLTPEQIRTLDQSLRAFEARKGSQVAVLMVPTIQPESIEQFGIRVADKWKIGRQKVDDGVILIVAKNDRTVRIEVGYGLEGALTDALSKRIIEGTILPAFRQQDFYAGIAGGVAQIQKVIDGEILPTPPQQTGGSEDGALTYLPVLFVISLVVGGILRSVLGPMIGAGITSVIVAAIGWFLAGALVISILGGVIAFFVTLLGGGLGSGYSGGSGGGFSSGGGGFSGGGGGFGGGGSSGRW